MVESVDIKGRALKWYIDNPLATLRDVGEEFEIPYETVRDWGKNEGWVSKRVMGKAAPPDQVLRQAEGIRIALYEEIIAGSGRGLPDLVKAWKSTMDIQDRSEEDETVDRDSLLQ